MTRRLSHQTSEAGTLLAPLPAEQPLPRLLPDRQAPPALPPSGFNSSDPVIRS
jgi:hypothetical protein